MSYPPPRLIFWETTAGCNLECIHCRRMTVADQLLPQDLTTAEAFDMIDQVSSFARPIFILSGGEPLFRPDIFDIAKHAGNSGLIVAMATNGTLIDAKVAQKIKDAGIRRVSISFDGADASTHDIFRGAGNFDLALEGMNYLKEVGIPYQINSTIAKHNVHQMDETYALAKRLEAAALHLFLLVPVGCGVEIADDQMIDPVEYERVLNWMYDREMEGEIELKATCAPHYFRIFNQRQTEERRQGIFRKRPASLHRQKHAGGRRAEGGGQRSEGRGRRAEVGGRRAEVGGQNRGGHPGNEQARQAMNAMTKGCLAGTGVCFVSHRGEVFPCGYLPVEAGNIRTQPFQEIWEGAKVFSDMRGFPEAGDGGKCGLCEFKNVCGGCRARAYGMIGDYLAEEPFCLYTPAQLQEMAESGMLIV